MDGVLAAPHVVLRAAAYSCCGMYRGIRGAGLGGNDKHQLAPNHLISSDVLGFDIELPVAAVQAAARHIGNAFRQNPAESFVTFG